MNEQALQHLNATFGALADPTRRAILARLSEGDLSVGELAEPFEMSLAAISKHLRVLSNAGLIRQEKEGRTRRCRLESQPLQEAEAWIARYRQFWEARLDRLGDYLQQTTKKEKASWPSPKQKPKRSSKSGATSKRRENSSSKPGRKQKP